MLKEFRDFAMRGNVMDLAIAVILGAAFGAIVTSLVNDIIMPIMGTIIGTNFASLAFSVNGVVIKYGAFTQAVVNFVLIAFSIFMLIKLINRFKKKKEDAPAAPTIDQQLLMEIRDALKNK